MKQLKELHDAIRAVEAEADHRIGILVDLQGPKLRVGNVAATRGRQWRGDAGKGRQLYFRPQ